MPSFITTKHRIDLTFHKLEKKINKVIDEYDKNKGMTIGLSKDLGVITHYIADYFTFPHNIEYPGTMTEHIHYEAQLKVDFREFDEKNERDTCTFPGSEHAGRRMRFVHLLRNVIQNICMQ